MSRIVSVWLKAWPIARLLQAQANAAPADTVDPCRPLALIAPGTGGPRIVALNHPAQRGGLVVGDLVSNARSKVNDLQTYPADPGADAAALRKLALWGLRYTPVVAPWDDASGADGLFLDITGCAHLFGGEAALLADLRRRLRGFGLDPRLAVAETAGASWAVARYGRTDIAIVPPGAQTNALQTLPLAALRLAEEPLSLLRRLGFRRIGEVIGQPRAPFAARFDSLLLRLDQALGHAPEPLASIVPPPVYRAQTMFLEPIIAGDHVLEAARRLLDDLTPALARDARGARALRLLLFRVDGGVQSLDIGFAAPSRDADHMARLIALRLDRLADGGLEADFGFEAAAIHVIAAESLPDRQSPLSMDEENVPLDALPQLIDRLRQRLGVSAVHQLCPHQSYIPERAVRACSPSPHAATAFAYVSRGKNTTPPSPPEEAWGKGMISAPRPLLLLPRPEPAEVVALIPEGPPRQFRWRRVLHQVVHAQGPERIAPEWWRRIEGDVERDYYLVEDTAGRRFWLYRAGLYGRDSATPPQWFLHGVLA